ncbi:hypothetical protein DRN86_00240 [Candidatus Geothermarchaeota archaeon]|nr:MAG: hypothetical protein DRN86_00240 [Candidatus Geothermarchaeota archaeon]
MRIIERIRKILSLDKKKKRTLILCPVCNSPGLSPISKFSGWLTPKIYRCDKCGYKGPVYLEVELDEQVKGA